MDNYAPIRQLTFPVVASALGIDFSKFKRAKEEYAGPCPIHGGKNSNSFRYHDSGMFNCFSHKCHGRGSLDLVMKVKNIGFQAAVELLTPLVGKEPPHTIKPVLDAPNELDGVLKPLVKDTWKNYQVPCEWLEKRVPDATIRERYGVFCYNNPARKSAYSGRVMLPIRNSAGEVYGYLGRRLHTDTDNTEQPSPKYLFPRNLPKSKFLFGAHELCTFGQLPLKRVFLVESPFSVMRFASLGIPAVSPFGWTVSEEQTEILSTLARGVVYIPDRNKEDDIQLPLRLLSRRMWVRCPPLPCEDPEQLELPAILALTK